MVREHIFEVDILRLSGMIICHNKDFKRHLPKYQISMDAQLVLVIWWWVGVAEQALSDMWRYQMRIRECRLICKVIDHGRCPRPEQLMQLHELKNFEKALKFKQPDIIIHCHQNLNTVFNAIFRRDISADDLVNMLTTDYSDFCD